MTSTTEPTEAMIEAGMQALFPYRWSSDAAMDRKMLAEIYRAMIASTPREPAQIAQTQSE